MFNFYDSKSLFFNLFGSFLFSFFFSLLFGYIYLYISKKYNIYEVIRNFIPLSHQQKNNTPTMGGIIIIITIILSILIFSKLSNKYNLYMLFALLSYGSIGLIDDCMKLFRKNNKGLTAKNKYILQSIFAVILIFFLIN